MMPAVRPEWRAEHLVADDPLGLAAVVAAVLSGGAADVLVGRVLAAVPPLHREDEQAADDLLATYQVARAS